jgi:hypothetical protein
MLLRFLAVVRVGAFAFIADSCTIEAPSAIQGQEAQGGQNIIRTWAGWEKLFANLIELFKVSPVTSPKIDFLPELIDHVSVELAKILLGFPSSHSEHDSAW